MDLASRARIKNGLESGRIMEWQKKAWQAKESGQNDLFSSSSEPPPLELEEVEPWTVAEALEAERQVVGFYLSSHPLDDFFAMFEVANWLNEVRRQNDVKYGSHLLNRPEQTKAKRNVYRSR